jgi:hypothetical protein
MCGPMTILIGDNHGDLEDGRQRKGGAREGKEEAQGTATTPSRPVVQGFGVAAEMGISLELPSKVFFTLRVQPS